MILKRMKRRHSRADAINLIETLRANRPEIVFGADLIAGFPTETEEMFQNSLNIIGEAGLTWMHIFPYSERPGTPAARIPNQVPKADRKARARKLREAGAKAEAKYLSSLKGMEASVLIERNGLGHSEGFAPVRLSGDVPDGTLVRARLGEAQDGIIRGEVLSKLAAA
jgi:threonylcarbamoyladenosine tRNA methylthiotransferase MtaB